MLLRLLRFLRGTAEFVILGAFPEKLLTKAVYERIPVWGIARKNGLFHANSYAGDYRRIARLAPKANARTKVVKKRGLPFMYLRYRKRRGMVLGLIAAAGIIYHLSSHIWIINVSGCSEIKEEEIYRCLEECGLKKGVAKKKINGEEIEKEMLLLNDGLSWITVNIRASSADVVIGEAVEAPEKIDPKDRYANVVASQDGVIRHIELYDGQSIVEIGDTVFAGEVMISGITGDQYGNTMLRYARGKVIAEVYIEYAAEVPFRETIVSESKTPITEREIYVLGVKLPKMEKSSEGEVIRTETSSKEFLYPLLSVRENRLFFAEETEILRTEFEAKEECMKLVRQMIAEDENIVCILSEESKSYSTKDGICVKTVLYAEKDIAETVEFSAYERQKEETVIQ